MGKDLHHLILEFFHKAVGGHQDVERIEDISNSEYYIFKIIRKRGMREIVVLLSDAYYYGDIDYHMRPPELNNGGMILIAKPESHFSTDEQENYESEKILIGKIGILLGALRVNDFWTYQKSRKYPKKK